MNYRMSISALAQRWRKKRIGKNGRNVWVVERLSRIDRVIIRFYELKMLVFHDF
jgi:hypothetical protein